MRAAIKDYMDRLNEREQKLVIITGVFLAVFLFYILIYSPLVEYVVSKQRILSEHKETLLWMEKVYESKNNFNSSEVLSNEKLLAVLSNSLDSSNLKRFPYHLEQTSAGDIRLNFAKVPYNYIMSWLWVFCGKYGLSVKDFTANSKSNNGVVSVNIVLTTV